MTILYINTGTGPNQGNGDSLRLAFSKINNNFSVLADNAFAADLVGAVISDTTLQTGITVTYIPQIQKASFAVNVADQTTLGAVKIGTGVSVTPSGTISVFDGNYNNLTNIPQSLGTSASPTFNNLHVTGNLDIAGLTTVINSTVITTDDLSITLAYNATSDIAANTAGLIINGPETPASLRYAASDDSWNSNKKFNAPSIYANGSRVAVVSDLGNIRFNTNIISTLNQNEDIVLNPDGNGRVRLVSSSLQFDNGNNLAYSGHLLYSAPNSGYVGLGIGTSNNSLRIVGDGTSPGIVADFGTYVGGTGTWTSVAVVNTSSVAINSTTVATSTTTGALVVAGGVGVGGALYVKDTVYSNGLALISISALKAVVAASGSFTDFQTRIAAL